MGKRRHEKQAVKPDLGRRKLLIAAGGTLLGSVLTGLLTHARLASGKPSMREFLEAEVFGRRGDEFTHPNFGKKDLQEWDPGAKRTFALMRPALEQKFGGTENVKMKYDRMFYEASLSTKTFDEYASRFRELSEQFFKDVGLPLLPTTFKRFTSGTEITGKGVEVLIFDSHTQRYYFEKDGIALPEVASIHYDDILGEANSQIDFYGAKEEFRIEHKRGTLMISLALHENRKPTPYDTFNLVNATINELLHYHTCDRTIEYVERDWKESRNESKEHLSVLLNKWRPMEEGVVHAAVLKWMDQAWLPKQKDVPRESLEHQLDLYDKKEVYKKVKPFFNSPLSSKELIHTYLQSPEKLQ